MSEASKILIENWSAEILPQLISLRNRPRVKFMKYEDIVQIFILVTQRQLHLNV